MRSSELIVLASWVAFGLGLTAICTRLFAARYAVKRHGGQGKGEAMKIGEVISSSSLRRRLRRWREHSNRMLTVTTARPGRWTGGIRRRRGAER